MEIQNRLGNSFPSTIFHSLEDVKIIAVSKRDIITDKRDLVKDLLEESITGLKNQIWKLHFTDNIEKIQLRNKLIYDLKDEEAKLRALRFKRMEVIK